MMSRRSSKSIGIPWGLLYVVPRILQEIVMKNYVQCSQAKPPKIFRRKTTEVLLLCPGVCNLGQRDVFIHNF